MFANFFFSGSSTAAQAPVADFTGTPLTGSAPLSVTFTDTSTNSPTSWLWEKNDGSGWVNFAVSHTSQNPTEDFGDAVWSVRLTATNAVGGNTKTRLDYVNATHIDANLEDLSDYLILVRPGDDAANNRLWKELAKSTHATAPGDHVLVATAPSPITAAYDLTNSFSTASLQLEIADGITYFETIGNEGDTGLFNSGVTTPVGTGPMHAFIWVYRSAGQQASGLMLCFYNVSVNVGTTGGTIYGYGAANINDPSGTISTGAWQLLQIFFDATAVEMGARTNQNDTARVATSPITVSGYFAIMSLFTSNGMRIGSFGFRNASPSEADLDLVYNAGPNGDSSDWPQPIPVTATVLYSGGIVTLAFGGSFLLGSGTAVVRIDGVNVNCPRVYQIRDNELWIRIPTANVCTSSSQVVTVTLPLGFISLGPITNQACTNNTNVETLLPTAPPANAGDIEIGINVGGPGWFQIQTMFSNAAASLSPWDTFGATATYGTNGLPLTLTGAAYMKTVMFYSVGNPYQTGNYLMRTKGAGSADLYYDVNTPCTVLSSGTAGGWNYKVFDLPVYDGYGINLRVVPPLLDMQMIFPGDWDTGTHLPSTVVNHDWNAKYGAHKYYRSMAWFPINDSLNRYITDFYPDGYFTQDGLPIRSATGTVVSATATTSVFLDSAHIDVWLITHAISGDPFHTGDWVVTGGYYSEVERVSATQYKTQGTSTAPSGAISFEVITSGSIQEMMLAANEMDQDVWMNIPHLMEDADVTAYATKVLATLEAGRKVRLELSNECWNFIFHQTAYFYSYARVTGTTGPIEYGRRAATVHKLFLDVFTAAGRASDLIRVVAWQAFNSGLGKDVMDGYKAWCVAHSYSFNAPHEYAITSYYSQSNPGGGSDPVSTRFRDFLMNGSNTPDPLPAAGLIDLAVYALLDPIGGTIAAATASQDMIDAWNTANSPSPSVRCCTYEGSQSMDGAEFAFSGRASGDGPNYAGSNGLDGAGAEMNLAYCRAQRHPRMVNAQYGSMQQCLDLGFSAWSQFASQAIYQRYGYWGDAEYFNQPVGNGVANLADLDNIVGSEAPKLYAEQQWIAAS